MMDILFINKKEKSLNINQYSKKKILKKEDFSEVNLIKTNKNINDYICCLTNEDIQKNKKKENLIFQYIQLYLKINNKEINDINQFKKFKIKDNDILENTIYKDGNCFFTSISSFFTGTEHYNTYYR